MMPSMSRGREPGVGERALGRLRRDLAACVRPDALRVVGVADADDGDRAADVVELAGESPVGRVGCRHRAGDRWLRAQPSAPARRSVAIRAAS